ncbi:hypothetical protein OCO52_12400 [Achromobacter mucicolens]|uniref:hypothetical protein n=1 Tax=Achromobacter mucicolens TaxID=1389922 RepID=UPI0020A4AA89|nr:hypothetical protein [Achromobacter mucicolens]MCP2517377.1 hypothetical protein [Achromobacter mucicolens]MCU6617278.1 hypothetical protein [Achromobacter mucicolens]
MRCKGLAGRLFSHDFRPVFDTAAVVTAAVDTAAVDTAAVDTEAVGTAPPKAKALVAGPSRDSNNVVGATSSMGDRFYNGHVCVRCGYKIIREL